MINREVSHYLEVIIQRCNALNINLLDVFTFFDTTGRYVIDPDVAP